MANQTDDNNDIGEVLENFKTAVDNGQLRLAMIHLVDIIDAIVDVLTEEEPKEQVIVNPGPITIEEPVAKTEEKPKQKNTSEKKIEEKPEE